MYRSRGRDLAVAEISRADLENSWAHLADCMANCPERDVEDNVLVSPALVRPHSIPAPSPLPCRRTPGSTVYATLKRQWVACSRSHLCIVYIRQWHAILPLSTLHNSYYRPRKKHILLVDRPWPGLNSMMPWLERSTLPLRLIPTCRGLVIHFRVHWHRIHTAKLPLSQ